MQVLWALTQSADPCIGCRVEHQIPERYLVEMRQVGDRPEATASRAPGAYAFVKPSGTTTCRSTRVGDEADLSIGSATR